MLYDLFYTSKLLLHTASHQTVLSCVKSDSDLKKIVKVMVTWCGLSE